MIEKEIPILESELIAEWSTVSSALYEIQIMNELPRIIHLPTG